MRPASSAGLDGLQSLPGHKSSSCVYSCSVGHSTLRLIAVLVLGLGCARQDYKRMLPQPHWKLGRVMYGPL